MLYYCFIIASISKFIIALFMLYYCIIIAFRASNGTLSISCRMEEYVNLRFHHQGEFSSTAYAGGEETVIGDVECDRFSYTVLMEYIKDDLKYSEIGGVYVYEGKPWGWKLLSNDADLSAVGQGLNNFTDFYIDNVVDPTIEPIKQMQPHVIIRPRQGVFAGMAMLSVVCIRYDIMLDK